MTGGNQEALDKGKNASLSKVRQFFSWIKRSWYRIRTPIQIQMEVTECAATALNIILQHYQRFVPSEQLRYECGVSRDGSNAYNLCQAARKHGLDALGYEATADELEELRLPAILYWNKNHFVVLESLEEDRGYINDPGSGRRNMPWKEFCRQYSGVAIELIPLKEFQKEGVRPSLFNLVWQRICGYRQVLLFVAAVQLALLMVGLTSPVFSRLFLDNIIAQKMISWLYPLTIAMGSAAAMTGLMVAIQGEVMKRLRAKMGIALSSRFLWHTLKLPMRFFMQRFGGEVISRLALNLSVTEVLAGHGTSMVLNVGLIAFYGIVMIQYDVPITLLAIATAGINIGSMLAVSKIRENAYGRLQQEQARLTGVSVDILQNVDSIKAAGAENFFFSRIAGLQARSINAIQSIGEKDQWLGAATGLLQQLAGTALLAVGCWRVMHGSLTIGMFVAFQGLMSSFLSPFGQLVGFGMSLQTLRIDLARINDVLDSKEDESFLIEKKNLSEKKREALKSSLELVDVSFGFSPLDDPLIDKMSLSIEPGQQVALVGKSGSGKTTTANLAAGLFPAWGGEVRYCGSPIKSYSKQDLSRLLATVNQDLFFFEGTVLENVTLWDTDIPKSKVMEALEAACVDKVVMEREGGLLARMTEGGNNFSEGQKQRLEIARALVRNPKILILDEATSALDGKTEKAVLKSLAEHKCACLVITHRLKAIRRCDEIIVMDKGKVVERGTHKALMNAGGSYHEMVQMETFI